MRHSVQSFILCGLMGVLGLSAAWAESSRTGGWRIEVKELRYSGPDCLSNFDNLDVFVRVGCATIGQTLVTWSSYFDLDHVKIARDTQLDKEQRPSRDLTPSDVAALTRDLICGEGEGKKLTVQVLFPGNLNPQNRSQTALGAYVQVPMTSIEEETFTIERRSDPGQASCNLDNEAARQYVLIAKTTLKSF